MKKYGLIIITVLLLSIQWAIAQPDKLRMSDLREINFNVVKLIGQYEFYSAFSSEDDYSEFIRLFKSSDSYIYCDIPNEVKEGDIIGIKDYIEIAKKHHPEVNSVNFWKINLPTFNGNKGNVDVEVVKSVAGTDKCKGEYKDSYKLIISVNFEYSEGRYSDYFISGIQSKTPRGKLIALKALNANGKIMANESFLINDTTLTTDNKGIVKFMIRDRNKSLIIIPLNKEYSVPATYNNSRELLANAKPRTSPCELSLVEFVVVKAIPALAFVTPDEKEKIEKQKAEQAKLEQEKADQQKSEQARLEKEKADQLKVEQARLNKEKADQQKAEQAKLEKEKAYQLKVEQARLNKEKADQQKTEQARLEKEKTDQLNAEQARLNKEKAEQQMTEQARLEKEKADQLNAEQARLNKEKAEQQTTEQARLEKENADQLNSEQARLNKEKADQQNAEQVNLEKEVAERQNAEQARIEKEKADHQKAEEARIEKIKADRQKAELAKKHGINNVSNNAKEKNKIPANYKFSVGINLNYVLTSKGSPLFIKNEQIPNRLTPDLSLGYGLGAGYEFKLGAIGKFQVTTGIGIDNYNYKCELDQYSTAYDDYDPDMYKYLRKVKIDNLSEEIKLSYLTVPLGLEKIFALNNSGWALSLNTSINAMFLSSARNKSSADILYSGYYILNADYYPLPIDLTISDNGIYDFGHFKVATSNSITAKSFLIGIDLGIGLTKKLGNRFTAIAKFRHRMSNNKMFNTKDLNSLSDNNSQIESMMNFKNNYNLRYNYLTLGLFFNL
jgi:hypothetical protein